jgi:hypothetical protein
MRSKQVLSAVISVLAAGNFCVSSTVRAQAAPANACQYITQAQVGAALGMSFGEGQPKRGAGGVTNCAWRSADQEITVGVGPVSELYFQKTKNSDMRMSAVPASGIGDEAHFRQSNVQMGTFYVLLYVRKGAMAFDVVVSGKSLSAAQMRQMETAVAQAVLTAGT